MISENDIIFDNLASEVFPYLDELRRTGEVNMYDSPTYVQDDFNVDKYMARKLVQAWMHDYDPDRDRLVTEEMLLYWLGAHPIKEMKKVLLEISNSVHDEEPYTPDILRNDIISSWRMKETLRCMNTRWVLALLKRIINNESS